MYQIQDWTGQICFSDKTFDSFEDAEEFLSNILDNNYDTDRQEYEIIFNGDQDLEIY